MTTNLLARPFVKWAGGKSQLLKEIKVNLPSDLLTKQNNLTYIEPFVGGGAMLFWILNEFPNIKRAIINDINPELICTYRMIQQNVEELIQKLQKIQENYLALSEKERAVYFLSQRDIFNSGNCSEIDTAALFIFLNKTCFNGLYRVNSKGKFNTPHGKYINPQICNANILRADAQLLQKVEVLCGDFAQTKQFANSNTLYYFDPPYRPVTTTASFTSYSKDGFNDTEQTRLRDFCVDITTQKSMFIASNSDSKDGDSNFFEQLYSMFSIRRVLAKRAINSNGNKRGKVSELLITNIKK